MKKNVFVLQKYALKYFKVKGHDVLQLNSQMVQKHNICIYAYRGEGERKEHKANKQTIGRGG